MSTVAILGGGISGLSCAYYLRSLGASKIKYIFLLEKAPKFGGWIQTTKFPDGSIFEHGPRTLRAYGKPGYNILALADELGLSSHVLPISREHAAAQNRFLWLNDRMFQFPNGIKPLFRTTPPFTKPLLGNVWKEWQTPKSEDEDESVHSFGVRRFGKEMADYFLDPMCRGVCAGDSRKISIQSLLPNLYRHEQEHGSVVKGFFKSKAKKAEVAEYMYSNLAYRAYHDVWSMWSFRNGLSDLVNAFACHADARGVCDLYVNAECTKLSFSKNKAVVTVDGEDIDVDHVFSTIPSKHLAPFLSTSHPNLSKLLASITSVSVALVYLEYATLALKYDGFGFLTQSTSDSKVLGVVFDSCCFPGQNGRNRTRLTCMMGGAWFDKIFGNVETVTENTLLEVAIDEVRKHLEINEPPDRHKVVIQKDCIPQYLLGHSKKLENIKREISDNNLCLSLCGASYEGAAVPDCIFNAKKVVEDYLKLEQWT